MENEPFRSGKLVSEAVDRENELRMTRIGVEIDPLSDAPAVIVQNAFSAGGAQIQSKRILRETEIYNGVGFSIRKHYSYRRGGHLLRGHNINAPVPGAGRPDATSGNVNRVESTASSRRHSLYLSLDRQLSGRLFFSASYVHARATDESDGPLSRRTTSTFALNAGRRQTSQGIAASSL
jgi:hypothetical protein